MNTIRDLIYCTFSFKDILYYNDWTGICIKPNVCNKEQLTRFLLSKYFIYTLFERSYPCDIPWLLLDNFRQACLHCCSFFTGIIRASRSALQASSEMILPSKDACHLTFLALVTFNIKSVIPSQSLTGLL